MITKEKEIKLLEELVAGDNYFAEYFKKDLEQMVSNIRNDFPIEHGTLFSMDGENQRQINEHLTFIRAWPRRSSLQTTSRGWKKRLSSGLDVMRSLG